jgi:hypothetical protein
MHPPLIEFEALQRYQDSMGTNLPQVVMIGNCKKNKKFAGID